MMQVGTNQSTTYHSQPTLASSSGQTGRSSSTSRQQQQQSQYDNEQLTNIRPRLCILRKWPYYDGYGVHLARNQHWLGLRIGDVEPNSPAESGGLLREDVVLAVNGRSVENDDFFVILSFIQNELEDDQIRFLVLDPQSADLARRHHINIDETYRTIIRMETPVSTVSPEKLLFDQWRTTNNMDPTIAQNIIHLGPTQSVNQKQTNQNIQQQRELSASTEGQDVYTFLPYSDHAVENGRSLFDILFDREDELSDSFAEPRGQSRDRTDALRRNVPGDHDPNKDRSIRNLINDGINKSGQHPESNNSTRRVTYDNKNDNLDSKIFPLKLDSHDTQMQPPSQTDDTSNNSRQGTRMCSIKLRPGIDPIGISLQSDKDVGHIIKSVELNSLADRAGIEKDDCIVSLNGIPLLNIPYDEVLHTLRQCRNESSLDFIVAKKSYLMKSRNEKNSNTTAEVMPSSNIFDRDTASKAGAAQTLEQLYNKYNNERNASSNDPTHLVRPRETVSTTTGNERPDEFSSPAGDGYPYSTKQQQGQFLHGVGPAAADQSSWGPASGKANELPSSVSGDSSIRSQQRGRQADADDSKGRYPPLEDAFKPLQVGITNPTASQAAGNISPTTIPRDNIPSEATSMSRPTSSVGPRDSSPKNVSVPDATRTNIHNDSNQLSKPAQTFQSAPITVPTVPSGTSDYDSKSSPVNVASQPDARLGQQKPTNGSSKLIQVHPPIAFDDDTDEEELSDISEKSDEEDTSDLLANEKVKSDIRKSVEEEEEEYDDEEDQNARDPYSLKTPTYSNVDTSRDARDNEDESLSDSQDNHSEPEQPAMPVRPIVKARRLDASESDISTSDADSSMDRRPAGGIFVSADAPIGHGDTKSWRSPTEHDSNPNQYPSNRQDQSVSKVLSEQQKSHDTKAPFDNDNETSSTIPNSNQYDQTAALSAKMVLATLSLSELKDLGYEFHDIQLMQPTETSPVGLKLTKQQDPLQYVITAVAKGTKADLAGLKVNDWLIKIEDSDIRLVEFAEVSHNIRQLLTDVGLINMVVARKRTTKQTPSSQVPNEQPILSTRPDSIDRQHGVPIATSLLTNDITRDPPNSTQPRFVPDQSTSPLTVRAQRLNTYPNEPSTKAPVSGPLSVGITNPLEDENTTKSPRSQSPSPIREYTISQQEPKTLTGQISNDIDDENIRIVELKEALGLDFNSFIPEGTNRTQTHFISNVLPNSVADKAGLRDGDRILSVNGIDVRNAVHEEVRRMMQNKRPLQLAVVNDPRYIDLIEDVKRTQNQPEVTQSQSNSPPPSYEKLGEQKSGSSIRSLSPVRNGNSLDSRFTQSLEPKQSVTTDEYNINLFRDEKGLVKVKHCILKKDPTYNGYGLVLRYQNGLHLIDQVEESSPAYNSGLRENDIILFVDKKNVESLTHDDVKMTIRKLSASDTDIDLILMQKGDVPRYKVYQERNSIDWQPILDNTFVSEPIQIEKLTSIVSEASSEQSSGFRNTSSSSNKQAAPVAPTSQSTASTSTRTCTLIPSVDRTAGFALSGKTAPPYLIHQVETDSPADKAGLRVNDALLYINGTSVVDASYEETVKLIKEALQKKSIELVVRSPSSEAFDNKKSQDKAKFSLGSGNESIITDASGSTGGDPSQKGANAVEMYQKQRNKELSYTLRLCHLNAVNADGTPAATFGFELTEVPNYEYLMISHVEAQSPAEVTGLQTGDVLLKVNERKTKGLGYDKVKKEIEKAKRDGRLEMLVVDEETFDYCQRTKKPLKEPEMKVKHIFPKSRPSQSAPKLPSAGALSSTPMSPTRDNLEQLNNSNIEVRDNNVSSLSRTSLGNHLSTPRESDSDNENNEKDQLSEQQTTSSNVLSQMKTARNSHPAVSFDLPTSSSPPAHASARSHESPLRFVGHDTEEISESTNFQSTNYQNVSNTSGSVSSQKPSKSSKAKVIPNAINNLFNRIGHSKSSKPDADIVTKVKTSLKTRAPSPPASRAGQNRSDVPLVSQSLDTIPNKISVAPISKLHDTVRPTVSNGSFDYVQASRRCVLKVDRSKGLGFVLCAIGDFDHTITAVEKHSAADIAGLRVNDEVLEIDGVDVRNVEYDQVVNMLLSAARTNDSIEMRVIDGATRNAYSSSTIVDKPVHSNGLLNSNNNNNTVTTTTTTTATTTATTVAIHSPHITGVAGDDFSEINGSISPFDSLNQQKIATSYPNLPGHFRHLENGTNRALSGSVPALATGITASPMSTHLSKNIASSSERGSITKLSDISMHDAPIARLCRIRKFSTSPFYGFFLCGDPKKIGRVFISDVTKHSPAAVCGLRDGDRIIEINGITVADLTYETILDKIKHHMARDDLELLVLEKKSVQWYRERNYPMTSRTLPTIVHIEPIINDSNSETQFTEIPTTHTKSGGFADRRVSKTGL